MNKKIALAAIVMVAVVMGISAFAPAAMAAPNASSNTTAICHIGVGDDEAPGGGDDVAETLFVNQGGKNAHLRVHITAHTGQDIDDYSGPCV